MSRYKISDFGYIRRYVQNGRIQSTMIVRACARVPTQPIQGIKRIVTPDLALILQIIRRANETVETHTSLSSRFINEFHPDMAALQCLPPTREPRVTEHTDHIKELITKVCSSIVANSANQQPNCMILCICCEQKKQ